MSNKSINKLYLDDEDTTQIEKIIDCPKHGHIKAVRKVEPSSGKTPIKYFYPCPVCSQVKR